MMAGIHFYSHILLLRSVFGWIASKFTKYDITNADHDNFLSIIQSAATFWKPGFDPRVVKSMPQDHPGTKKPTHRFALLLTPSVQQSSAHRLCQAEQVGR